MPESEIAPNALELEVLSMVLKTTREEPGALLPVLYGIQRRLGYVPSTLACQIAHELNRSLAEVSDALISAPGLRSQPASGLVVQVCRGDACSARGAEGIWAHLCLRAKNKAITPEPVYCLGSCGAGPSVQIEGTLHVGMNPERLDSYLG